MARYIAVAKPEDVAPGEILKVMVHGISLAVFNLNGDFFALDNSCPHKGANLAEGSIEEGDVISCPWHSQKYEIRTGKSLGPWEAGPVGCYKVRIKEGWIEVRF